MDAEPQLIDHTTWDHQPRCEPQNSHKQACDILEQIALATKRRETYLFKTEMLPRSITTYVVWYTAGLRWNFQ